MLRAGDTDTNGAIVGGMIGAYYGKNALPKMMVDKVLNCDLK
jgi:ADP-ribosylglycohydrolase